MLRKSNDLERQMANVNPIAQLFANLKERKQTALMPFVTAGDPDLEFTAQTILALQNCGCHLLELGFPYSDPIADGPVIQESYSRALINDLSVDEIFELVQSLSPQLSMPVVSMVSYSIIYRIGTRHFISRAKQCGFAGAIIPDLPFEESGELQKTAADHDFAICPLITPMTSDERAAEIAKTATGFIYFVSVVGITGERTSFAATLTEKISTLRQSSDVPICVGFGISRPEHIAELSPVADGLIVGSAFVRRIAAGAQKNREQTINEIVKFAESLLGVDN